MDEVTAILARDFGLRPQGKSAPMAASKIASAGGASLRSGSDTASAVSSSWSNLSSGPIPNSASDPFIGDYDFTMPSSRKQPDFDDIFGGPPIKPNPPTFGSSSPSNPSPVFDSLLGDFGDSGVKSSALPVHKKPVIGGSDFFDAVPGPGSNRSSFGYDDVFFSVPSMESNRSSTPQYEDLLQDFGHPVQKLKSMNRERSNKEKTQSLSGTDDLIPGFGGSSSTKIRAPPRASLQKPSVSSSKPTTSVVEDPFVLFEINETQNKQTPDLESFFSMGARASSVPKQRPTVDIMFDVEAQNNGGHDGMRTSSSSPSIIRKASSATNFMNDFSSIWGGPPSSGEFQEIGESEERIKARLERHYRTVGRMEKALAEKAERDMQIAQEQAERQNIAGAIDIDIKQWVAGKEGNIRAMLSSLQYILWPQCGWQSVSLTDLITSDAVKKVYRKANLCIHPDKVQQKGATVEQKYIAEKVFDLLKEAYKKFSSEELR